MKIITKVAALLMAAAMTLSLASCGSSDSSSAKTEKTGSDNTSAASENNNAGSEDTNGIKGKTETSGEFTVFVPEGWTLKGVNKNGNNRRTIIVCKDTDPEHEKIRIEAGDEAYIEELFHKNQDSTRNAKKGVSDIQDVASFTCGDYEIIGIKWNEHSLDGFEGNKGSYYRAKASGKAALLINVATYVDTTPEFKAIVGSLK